MAYHAELCRAMTLLADAGATFFGQAVLAEGTAMQTTLRHIPEAQRIELPVAEDMQMGLCTGVALAGGLPVCVYPRINFLILALNQLVLHLDKLPLYSHAGYNPKVIIRTAIATNTPLDPQAQHVGNYTAAIRAMLSTVRVEELLLADEIVPAYREALARDGSTLLVEYTALYEER